MPTGADAGTDELYQRLVLDHGRHPRNQGPLPGATHLARGDNPFCGDRWLVSLILDGDRIREVRYEGAGCAISTAAASMMSEAVTGKTTGEVAGIWQVFHSAIAPTGSAGAASEPGADQAQLGDLAAFIGVRRYPVRVKCARLPWQTLLAALSGARDAGTVSTE